MEERIHKILARAGLGSRRACEELVRSGRVVVNGEAAKVGRKADPARDTIEVDGKAITVGSPDFVYLAVHKPRGVISTTRDERGRATVRDLIPLGGRLYPAGRLDRGSEGLILLTNDGELTDYLTHPRYGHTKEYHVCLQGRVDDAALKRWREGISLAGKGTRPAKVSILAREEDRTWVRVILREGRKRQIRRVAELLGYPVRRLIRVRIGPVHLGDLQPGRWRHLTESELGQLRAEVRRRRPR